MTRRNRRGSNAVEFAITAPVLMLLAMGTFDYSWYFVQKQAILSSAQVGARAGSQTKLSEGPEVVGADAAEDTLRATYFGPIPSGTSVTGTVIEQRMVRIDIDVPYQPLTGYLPVPTRIVATSQMLVEDLR